MKRFIAAILAASTVFVLAACGGKFTCTTCQQEKSGKKHVTELMGQKITMCDDCYSQLQGLGDLIK